MKTSDELLTEVTQDVILAKSGNCRTSPESFNYDNILDSGQAGMTTFGDAA